MPWKTDESGNVLIESGNPIFQHPDGREEQFNADAMMLKLKELTTESAKHRGKYNQVKKELQPLLDAGIEDVPEYLKSASEAISLVKTYKEKGNPGVEEIERIKEGVASTFEARLSEKEKHYSKLLNEKEDVIKHKDEMLRKQLIKSAFNSSDFIRKKTNMIPEFAYDSFGKHFIVEEKDGDLKTFALDSNGDKIFSLQGSNYADPQEAIEILIKSHPQKDKLLKSGSGGSGATGGGATPAFTGSTIDGGDQGAISRNLEKIASGEVAVA
ncbi:MAG: hypothetical protein B6244_14530 [Candidatus Cloacimonetes bacterium 4572_55]|nr:MAG: hypothetical protein B6244_14530 [Candidatus Cloacimonetes bacterium 4572_55]